MKRTVPLLPEGGVGKKKKKKEKVIKEQRGNKRQRKIESSIIIFTNPVEYTLCSSCDINRLKFLSTFHRIHHTQTHLLIPALYHPSVFRNFNTNITFSYVFSLPSLLSFFLHLFIRQFVHLQIE